MASSIERDKIKKKIAKIRNTMDKQGKYGYYLLIDNQVKLLAKGNNERDLKHKVFTKLAEKRSTIGCYVYQVEIHINEDLVDKPIKIVAGPVHLTLKQFKVSPRFKLIREDTYHYGALFYTNTDILNGGFHFTDIKQLVKEVNDRNISIHNMNGKRALWVLETSKNKK